MDEEDKNDGGIESNSSEYIIKEAEKIVDMWLNRQTSIDETLEQAGQIIERSILKHKFEELGQLHEEFMKDYNPQIRRIATILAFPLIEELDNIEARKKEGTADTKELFKVHKNITFKTIDIAVALAKESPGMNPPGEKDGFGYDPLEVSTVFVHFMSKRFGDDNYLAPVGWQTFLNGLVGTDISLLDQVESSEEYIKGITGNFTPDG